MDAKMSTSTLQRIASLRNFPFDTCVRAASLKFINMPVGLGGISGVVTSALQDNKQDRLKRLNLLNLSQLK